MLPGRCYVWRCLLIPEVAGWCNITRREFACCDTYCPPVDDRRSVILKNGYSQRQRQLKADLSLALSPCILRLAYLCATLPCALCPPGAYLAGFTGVTVQSNQFKAGWRCPAIIRRLGVLANVCVCSFIPRHLQKVYGNNQRNGQVSSAACSTDGWSLRRLICYNAIPDLLLVGSARRLQACIHFHNMSLIADICLYRSPP